MRFMFDCVPDPRLPDVEREVVVELAGDHLVSGLDDRIGTPLLESLRLGIDERGRLLDVAVRVIDRLGHVVVADREVLQRALCLRAPPIPVGGYVDVAHGVEFLALTGRVDANRHVLDRLVLGSRLVLAVSHLILLALGMWFLGRVAGAGAGVSRWGCRSGS